MQYNIDIFAHGTSKISSNCGYQVFITRTYVKELDSFYITSFSILKNKEQRTYEVRFEEIKKKMQKIIIILKLHQNFFIEILKKVFLILLKKCFLI